MSTLGSSLAARFALATFALAAAASGLSAIQAQTAEAETSQLAQSPASDNPRFLPAGPDADFDAHFAPYDAEALPDVTVAPGAVDLTTIEPAEPEGTSIGTGVASYYGRRFHGRLTANGERFDMNALTAAHKTLPFGSRVKVVNPANGRSVVVRINDRGPFVAGREIDLSRKAAQDIGIVASGHGTVELVLLGD